MSQTRQAFDYLEQQNIIRHYRAFISWDTINQISRHPKNDGLIEQTLSPLLCDDTYLPLPDRRQVHLGRIRHAPTNSPENGYENVKNIARLASRKILKSLM